MRILQTSCVFFVSIFLALSVFAQEPENPDYTVDETTRTVTIKAGRSIDYNDIDNAYRVGYTINIPDDSTLTYVATDLFQWMYQPLTGKGTFKYVSQTNKADWPQEDISNLAGFEGRFKLVSESGASLRLRASGYGSFAPPMIIDVSGNSQFYINSEVHCNIELHDMEGAYDGMGLLRIDGSSGTKLSQSAIFIDGKIGIGVRTDGKNVTQTLDGSIFGLHEADDVNLDSVVFNGAPATANTYATLVLKKTNRWNGTTEINHMNVEITEDGCLGNGTIYLSPSKTIGDFVSYPGTLTINCTENFTLPAIKSNPGNQPGGMIVKKNDNIVTITDLNKFNGTLDIQGGTIQAPALVNDSLPGGIILKGTGTYFATNESTGSEFRIDKYDMTQFEGTFELQKGRTRGTFPRFFGENATVKINSGASFMVIGESENMAAAGDFPSKFILAGNGHSEQLGAIRFHVSLNEENLAKLNDPTANALLPNIAGPVELAGDTKIVGRTGGAQGWGAITGNITGTYTAGDTTGAYNLTFNESVGKGWILLTGTNSYGETILDAGTVQLGYKGTINGKEYDGTTGTLGKGKVTVNADAVLDYRRVNEYNFTADIANAGTIKVSSGALTINENPTGNGTIDVAEDATLNVNLALNTTNKITGTGTVNMNIAANYTGAIKGFSDFEGTLNISSDTNLRYMLNNQTIQFGPGRTIIQNSAQLYLNNTTIYGNLEFGDSTAYGGDAGYPGAIRSDGTATSKVYGTITLTDDKAAIVTRASNGGNVENGSKLVLYADVTGSGSLTKREDSTGYAGVLTFATATEGDKTYGGTVDYAGTTNVKTGIMRFADGVTMYAQDTITVDPGAILDFQEGSTLSVGAKEAVTGTTLNVGGTGELHLNGDMALDIYSASDFDQLIFNGLNLVSSSTAQKKITVIVANSANLGDTFVPVVFGLTPETLADWMINVTPGYGYMIQDDGTLLIGNAPAVPEPSTLVLLVLGFGLIAGKIGRKRFCLRI